MFRSLQQLFSSRLIRIFTVAIVFLVAQLLYTVVSMYWSPGAIRHPQLEHYHFRMQIIVNGKAENFSTAAYQMEYAKDACTTDLPEVPIHFHDGKDQIVHIHWEGMTGGLVMKNYGWNYIGGRDDALGYRLEKLTHPVKVPIHGKDLPAVPAGSAFFVYTGDGNGYKERSFNEWKNQDLEQFFGVISNFPAHSTNKTKTPKQNALLKALFPKAYAHTSEAHDITSETEAEKLTRINNLLGNVVIFVQKESPSDQQIKDRFNHLEPLSESTCGG